MENKASYLLIGSFVLAAIVATFAFVIWLARHDSGSTDRVYDIFFTESVSGLGLGGEVRYRGIRIGQVVDIAIRADDPSRVAVRVEVADEPVLRDGDVAELSLQGITGLAFINIAGATAGAAPLVAADGQVAVVPSKASSIDQLLQGAPDLVSSANRVANRLEEILGSDNQNRISGILGDIQTLSSTLSTNAPSMTRIVESVDGSAQSFARVSESMETLIPQLQSVLANIDQRISRFDSLMVRVEGLADSADTTLSSVTSTVEAAGESVSQLSARGSALMDNAEATLDSATATLASVSGSFKVASDAVADLSSRASGLIETAEGTVGRAELAIDDAGAAARSINGLLDSEDGDFMALVGDLRSGMKDVSTAVSDLPELVAEFRSTAQSFDQVANRANALLANNTEAVEGFMGDGLNEFYRFIAESRRLVSALTRISDRLEREGARFLLPSDSSDGYTPRGSIE